MAFCSDLSWDFSKHFCSNIFKDCFWDPLIISSRYLHSNFSKGTSKDTPGNSPMIYLGIFLGVSLRIYPAIYSGTPLWDFLQISSAILEISPNIILGIPPVIPTGIIPGITDFEGFSSNFYKISELLWRFFQGFNIIKYKKNLWYYFPNGLLQRIHPGISQSWNSSWWFSRDSTRDFWREFRYDFSFLIRPVIWQYLLGLVLELLQRLL